MINPTYFRNISFQQEKCDQKKSQKKVALIQLHPLSQKLRCREYINKYIFG